MPKITITKIAVQINQVGFLPSLPSSPQYKHIVESSGMGFLQLGQGVNLSKLSFSFFSSIC